MNYKSIYAHHNPVEQIDLISGLCDKIVKEFHESEILFHAVIPVTRHIVKKNNRPIIRPFLKGGKRGTPIIGKSDDLRAAEEHLTLSFKSRANEINFRQPIRGPIWVVLHFYYKHEDFFTKEGEPSKTRGDLSNLYQLPEDCLQSAGIILDDSQICSHDLSRRLVGDRTELEVFVLRHQFDFRATRES